MNTVKSTLRLLLLAGLCFTQVHCQCQLGNSWSGASATSSLPAPMPTVEYAGDLTGPDIDAPNYSGKMRIDPEMAHPVLLSAKRQTTYLKINLTGFEMEEKERSPINVAIVLDQSGSMSGEKIGQAKQAAIMAVERLRPQDIVSVIAYSDVAQVLVPARKARDLEPIIESIRQCWPSGSTALYDGLSAGISQVRENLDDERINRVVLLSDGLANVGPSSITEFTALAANLRKAGIGVTTMGLGLDYNSELMTELALHSEGNHAYIKEAQDIEHAFEREFGVGLSVAAKNVRVKIRFADGVTPLRVLNSRTAVIQDRQINAHFSRLYSGHQASLLLEIEVPPGIAGSRQEIATVDLSYTNMKTHQADFLSRAIAVAFSDSLTQVRHHERRGVMVAVAQNQGVRWNLEAVRLRDQGQYQAARDQFRRTSAYLEQQGKQYQSALLAKQANESMAASEDASPRAMKETRNLYDHRNLKNFGSWDPT